MVVCPLLLAELEDVLLRPKFRLRLPESAARRYVELLVRVAERHPDPVVLPGATADPDDDYLVALTHAVAADYLVSGDPHLTKLELTIVPVLTPRAFLQRLLGTAHDA